MLWSFDELKGYGLRATDGALGSVHVLGRTVATNDFLYYLTWGIGLLLAGAAWLLVRGRVGRAFRALRDSEVAAASSGVNTAFYKTLAFGISGFYAGVGGSLFVLVSNWFVSPSTFLFDKSLLLVVGAVVGGSADMILTSVAEGSARRARISDSRATRSSAASA